MNNINPLISIIVPVHNSEKYIDECVISLINQSYTNLEILLIDDGSNDKSSEKCDYYACLDKRINVIHKKNEGVSSARNTGLSIVKGEYIGFVDSDDYCDIDMYYILMNACLSFNSDISICDYSAFSKRIKKINTKNNNPIVVLKREEALNKLFQDKIRSFVCNKLIKKDLFKDVFFPTGFVFEDMFVTQRLFSKVNHVVQINDKLYFYRINTNSITHNITYKIATDYIIAVETRIQSSEFIESDNVKNNYYLCVCKYLIVSQKNTTEKNEKIDLHKKYNEYINKIDKNKLCKNNIIIYFSLKYLPWLYGFLWTIKNNSKYSKFLRINNINIK